MRQTTKSPGEKIVKDIKRATRKHYSSEEKIRIVLDGLRGEDSMLNCAVAKGSRRASITNGQRTSWRLASDGWLGTQLVRPRLTKSKTFAVRPVI